MEEQKLKEERARLSDTVIRNHMLWAMGAGFIPIPVADFLAIGAIQLDMVRQMCKVYGLNFKESEGKAIVSALTSSALAKLGARAIIKIIPGIGSVVGGVALAIVSGASTFALGEVFKKHFENGGTILDFDVERLKKVYDDKFEKGKEMARKIREEQEAGKTTQIKMDDEEEVAEEPIVETETTEDSDSQMITKLQNIADLKEKGVISDQEFEILKARILES